MFTDIAAQATRSATIVEPHPLADLGNGRQPAVRRRGPALDPEVARGAQLATPEVLDRLAELRKAIREVRANITGRAGSHDPRLQSLLDFHQ